MKKLVSKLGRFNFTIHNVVAHPVMEALHILGFTEAGNRIHDMTLPEREEAPTQAVLEANDDHKETIRLFSEWCQCMGVDVPFNGELTPREVNKELQLIIAKHKVENTECGT